MEDDLQATFVEWFDLKFPQLVLFAIPNGGKRNAFEAARLQRQGVRPGVPDLFLALMRKGYGGLYIELKVEKRKPTEKQADMHRLLRVQGYRVEVCNNFEEAAAAVYEYLGVNQ